MKSAKDLVAETLASAQAPCLTCSFQTEDVVVLHMLRDIRPGVPVLFLDTFHHFVETLAYRDELVRRWSLNVINVKAAEPRIGLWQSSTNDCCARHKVGPLFAALEDYDVWFTGLRREQSPSRANLSEVEEFSLPSGKRLAKISPLAMWSTRDVWAYAKAESIPVLSLYDIGYPSIGCEPCTTLPPDPMNPRSGRWSGQKLECGIHIQPVDK
jgi:phosphoadenosine phosphosulfate reductase